MKLRSKTFLVIGVVMLAMVLILIAFSSMVLQQSYANVENAACQDDLRRISSSLVNQETQLNRNVKDWAEWDATYEYSAVHNSDFEVNNLDDSAFANLQINMMAIVDNTSNLVKVTFFDLTSSSKVPAPQTFMDLLTPDGDLLSGGDERTGVSGILDIDGRPLIVSTHPILTSLSEGPARGHLIMGRYLDTPLIGAIENLTGSKFGLFSIYSPQMSAELDQVSRDRVLNGDSHLEIVNDSSVLVFGTVRDAGGSISMVIRSEMTRDVYFQGQTALSYLNSVLIVVGILFTLVSVLFIEQFIISRVRRLEEDVAVVRDEHSLSKRVRIDGSDELSTLSGSINLMLESLQTSEADIHKSEERYRMVVEDQTDLIFRIDRDLNITFANGQFCSYFGKAPGKAIGHTSLGNIIPDHRSGYLLDVQSLTGTNNVVTKEIKVVDIQGRERVHQWTLRGISEDDGAGEVQIVGNDITERKQIEYDLRKHRENLEELVEKRTAELLNINRMLETEIDRRTGAEKELQTSEERYRDLVNNQGEGILLVDDKGVVTFSNPAADDLFGVPNGNLVDRLVADFTDEEGQGRMRAGSVARNSRTTFRWALIRPDGEGRTLLVTATPRIGPEGSYQGLFAIFRDITVNDKMEQSLRKREAEYRSVVEDQTDLISRSLPDGTVTFVNGAFCRFFGRPADQLIGKVFDVNLPDGDDLDGMFAELTPESPTINHEFRVTRMDGETRWLQYTFRGIFDPHGRIQEVQSVGRDVSERVQMEQEMVRAQKLESLGTMAGGIAHDFNNVLTSIVGNVSLIKMKMGANDPLLARLEETELAIIRAKRLADRLLTFSKGGAPVKEAYDIREVVPEAVQSGLSESASLSRFEFAPTVDLVEIDKGQMTQALSNLIRNASDAMKGGGEVVIKVSDLVVEEDWEGKPAGSYVAVSVADRGPGISRSNMAKLFDPYFSTKGAGKGLGLSTALSIAKKHGGWIDIETEIGAGTTFILMLPSAITGQPDPVRERTPSVDSRILLMDDEESILEVGKELLEANGFIVETAKDGEIAIEKYIEAKENGEAFNVVIMDLTVHGGMGGKEAITELLKYDPGAVAIVSSGYSNDPVMADYRKFGFSGVVQKPYLIQSMIDKIRSVRRQ